VGLFRNGRFFAIHTDHLGTPRLMTNDVNKPVWQWPYSAFGTTKPTGILKATVKPKNAMTNQPVMLKATQPAQRFDLRYPGQMEDAETGTFQNYWRSLDAKNGRYTQYDPIGLAGGLNPFTYADNTPLTKTDPNGLQAVPMPAPPIPGIPSPGSPSPRPLDPTEPGGPSTTPGFEWPKLLPDSWVDWIIEKARGKWTCTASCNVQQINPNVCCPDRVTGTAGGPNEPAACVEAERAATQSCYPRHCQCRCSKR